MYFNRGTFSNTGISGFLPEIQIKTPCPLEKIKNDDFKLVINVNNCRLKRDSYWYKIFLDETVYGKKRYVDGEIEVNCVNTGQVCVTAKLYSECGIVDEDNVIVIIYDDECNYCEDSDSDSEDECGTCEPPDSDSEDECEPVVRNIEKSQCLDTGVDTYVVCKSCDQIILTLPDEECNGESLTIINKSGFPILIQHPAGHKFEKTSGLRIIGIDQNSTFRWVDNSWHQLTGVVV